MSSNNGNLKAAKKEPLQGRTQAVVLGALFTALSIIFGKFLSFTAGPFRISFENLTILMAGIFLGPLMGMIVGICADLVGCLIVGYAINPIITAGAAVIGLISGLVYRHCFRDRQKLRLGVSVGAAHIAGSMIIKSIGLRLYFNYPYPMLALRIPLYLVIGLAESYIIYLLLKNKIFRQQVKGGNLR